MTIGKFATHSVIMLLNGHDFFFLLAVRLCFSLKIVAVPILASAIAVNKVTIRLGLDEKSRIFSFRPRLHVGGGKVNYFSYGRGV